MMQRWGIDVALFSLKCYGAAMLAIFVALSIGLERPYWAFLTAYIVSGPLAGAVVSRALYRLVGTVVGGAFSIFIVPPLVQAPVLLVAAMSLWLGLCVFLSLLDRSPTSYVFVLAGYTAGLIVWPIVDAPTHVFTIATLRMQEIGIGIMSSALLHGAVMPNSVSRFLRMRADAIVSDAERWSVDMLSDVSDRQVLLDRRRLTQDIGEIHNLAAHLPFESSGPAPRIRVVRALEEKLAQILPLGAAVADRLEALGERLPMSVTDLVADVRDWIAQSGAERSRWETRAGELRSRCDLIEARAATQTPWETLLLQNLLSRLSGLIEAHRDVRLLQSQLETPDRRPVSIRIPHLLASVSDRPQHRDIAGALRAAGGAALTAIIAATLWIASGWPDGGTFVMLASICPSLFAAMDNAVLPVIGFFKGTVVAIFLGALYGFAVLPMLDGFPEMAAALAPPLIVLGSLLAVPKYFGIALPALLGLGSPFIISERFGAELGPGVPATFATFLNSQIATLAALLFAAAMIRIVQTGGVGHAISRTLRASWRDLAARASGPADRDMSSWLSRMLDRHALLAPRLAATGTPQDEAAYDIMRDLHTGVAVGELRKLRSQLDASLHEPIARVVAGVGEFYRGLVPHRAPADAPELLERIDHCLRALGPQVPEPAARAAALPLVTLRRTLFPCAPPPRLAPGDDAGAVT